MPGERDVKSARRRWFLLGAVLFGATAGFCVSLWSWPQDEAGSASAGRTDGARAPFFSDPAFSPSASVADLKQAAQRAAEELVEAFPHSPDARDILARTHDRLGALGSPLGQQEAAGPSRGGRSKPGATGPRAGMEQPQDGNDGVAATRQVAFETHLGAGRCYRQHGQVEKAVEMLRKAAILAPQDVRSRTELLAIHVRAGHDREALEVCRQLSRIEPDRGDHWLKLALLRVRLDDLEGAKSALERALELDPDNAQYRELERVLEEEG